MSGAAVTSWNRRPVVGGQSVVYLRDRGAPLPALSKPFIAYGNGRSYGDVCLNEGGVLLNTRRLDKFVAFDAGSGRLCCEAGVLLGEILDVVVPRGWFLPVTPGTAHVTVGGAIANDVHGKNHHVAGSFGHHVRRLALRRSDGSLLVCGPDAEPVWFAATVGGLGLTGVIVWAEIQLIALQSPFMAVEPQPFSHLDEFWDLNAAASAAWPYTVAWIDCMEPPGGRRRGRGVLLCARHAEASAGTAAPPGKPRRIGVDAPFSLVRPLTARLFNEQYFRRQRRARAHAAHFRDYFYPLDRLLDWNRLYGKRGFFQYQCVLPFAAARDALPALLARIGASRETAFLGVLKSFGELRPVGMLSFARPGVTLAVDFPNRGASTARLFADLDAVVVDAGGALYPAKDARMPAHVFRAGFPAAGEFAGYVDAGASSSFWRRVSA